MIFLLGFILVRSLNANHSPCTVTRMPFLTPAEYKLSRFHDVNDTEPKSLIAW